MKLLKASRIRRLIQVLCLGLFLYLLGQAVWPAQSAFPPPDLFLRLDPLAALALPLAARELIGRLIPGLAVIGLTLVLGRVFCGYICPFGFTLDLVSWLKRRIVGRQPTTRPQLHPGWSRVKYGILIAILTAALTGISLVFWGSPIALITRFYALLMHPLTMEAGGSILHHGDPLFETLGWTGAAYISIKARAFDSFIFLLLFFGLLFWLEWRRPRFWCRVLYPAGALLALASRRPSWRRRVADKCIHCGRCHRDCPASTISPDGVVTGYGECLTCQSCVNICPVQAVKFGFGPERPQPGKSENSAVALIQHHLSRRLFLGSAAAGLGLAWFQSRGLSSAIRLVGGPEAWPAALQVRPPGSRPEARFLALCLRCGECIKACPANALAPAALDAGLNGLFSPRLMARRGPCEPECNRCGQVCPSGAIANLPLPEKRWAKMGTALVLKETCLAWAEDRRCVVCQEVCPYGSIDLVQEAGLSAPVPVVRASRCFGCGYCERHCPVEVPAIVVEPAGALRLEHDEYRKIAQAQGLDLDPEARALEEFPDDQLPPGFLE